MKLQINKIICKLNSRKMNRWIDLSSYNIKLTWLDYTWSNYTSVKTSFKNKQLQSNFQPLFRNICEHFQAEMKSRVVYKTKNVYPDQRHVRTCVSHVSARMKKWPNYHLGEKSIIKEQIWTNREKRSLNSRVLQRFLTKKYATSVQGLFARDWARRR